jgi:alanine racemase
MTESLITAEVDLSAIAHNTRAFANHVGPGVKIMPAVKADGYGHGAIQVSRTALENGASALGVARTEEGIILRQAGIDAPILVFGYVSPKNTQDLMDYDLTATVSRKDVAQAMSDQAMSQGKTVKVHVKVDTGMGRIGLVTPKGHPGCDIVHGTPLSDVMAMATMPGIELEGIYTHFASSDSLDKTYTHQQLAIFMAFIETLKQKGLEFPLKHAANSAAAIELPESHLDMIRPGISFYGLKPSDETDMSLIDIRPVMQLKSRIVSLKCVPRGFKVSYGSTYLTEKETVIAVVPIGYADGFSRHFSSNGHMLVRGPRASVVGRICMDLTMLDVGHIPDLCLEEEVVVFGRQNNTFLSVDELASRIDTIHYEIVSNLSPRVKRVYLRS